MKCHSKEYRMYPHTQEEYDRTIKNIESFVSTIPKENLITITGHGNLGVNLFGSIVIWYWE